MTKTEIFDKLKPIIIEVLNRTEEEVTLTATLEDLRADSLDTVELMMAVEKQFELPIPDEHMEKFTNVQSIVDYITERCINNPEPFTA